MGVGGHLEKREDRCNRLQVSYPMFRLGLLSSREFVLPCNNITIWGGAGGCAGNELADFECPDSGLGSFRFLDLWGAGCGSRDDT